MQRRNDISPPIALSIAGHDPSSGAGVTADLQTFAAHRVFGVSAITALTVQSTLGVSAVETVSPQFLRQTLDALEADLPAQGIKIGMLGSAAIAAEVAAFLADKPGIPTVLDPILRSSSGAALLEPEGLKATLEQLLPMVAWATPNWMELSALTGLPVASLGQAEAAMHHLGRSYPHLTIVATGGDQARPIDQLRLPGGEGHNGEVYLFAAERVETRATHGTGCAFSSALLCRLLHGDDPITAVRGAKEYVTEALRRAPEIGHGNGPLDLLWPLR
jgi:hydroxymethylpyrimidine/phosphomethylpyrimidine kinase